MAGRTVSRLVSAKPRPAKAHPVIRKCRTSRVCYDAGYPHPASVGFRCASSFTGQSSGVGHRLGGLASPPRRARVARGRTGDSSGAPRSEERRVGKEGGCGGGGGGWREG